MTTEGKVVYCLMVEDPWDEYYEHKLKSVHSSRESVEEERRKYSDTLGTSVEEMVVDKSAAPN